MSPRIFPTAQDAENAFYEALERADLEAMMAVWAEDEEIICVHPTGPRLTGRWDLPKPCKSVASRNPSCASRTVHDRVRVAQIVFHGIITVCLALGAWLT